MTWRELLLLAQRFSGNSDLKGLYTPYYDYADLLIEMGKADKRRWYDASRQEVHFGTDSWKGLIADVVAAYSSGEWMTTEVSQLTYSVKEKSR